MKNNEDSRNPDPEQWWEIYNGVWAKGSKMRDIELGFVEEKSIDTDFKQVFENDKRELYNPLAESAFVKDLMEYDAFRYKDKVLDVIVELEKDGKTKDIQWDPLADIPPSTMLMLQKKELKLDLKVCLDRQDQKMGKEYMKRRKIAADLRNEMFEGRKVQREKMEQIRKEKEEVERQRREKEEEDRRREEEETKDTSGMDWESSFGKELKKIAKRQEIIDKKLEEVWQRQEERIAKEKEAQKGVSKEYDSFLKELLDATNLGKDPERLKEIEKRIEKFEKREDERIWREKHGPDISKKLDELEVVQKLLLKRQEARIAKQDVEEKIRVEKESVQEKRDSKQEEEIKSGKETDTSQDEQIHQLRNDLDSLGLVVKFNFALVIIVILAFGYFVLGR